MKRLRPSFDKLPAERDRQDDSSQSLVLFLRRIGWTTVVFFRWLLLLPVVPPLLWGSVLTLLTTTLLASLLVALVAAALLVVRALLLVALLRLLLLLTATLTPCLLRSLLRAILLLAVFFMVVLLFLFGSFQGTEADLAHEVYKLWFYFPRLTAGNFYGFQLLGYSALGIELFDLAYSFNANRVLFVAVGQHIPHDVFENILLDKGRIAFTYLQQICIIGKVLKGIKVGIQFVVETAF